MWFIFEGGGVYLCFTKNIPAKDNTTMIYYEPTHLQMSCVNLTCSSLNLYGFPFRSTLNLNPLQGSSSFMFCLAVSWKLETFLCLHLHVLSMFAWVSSLIWLCFKRHACFAFSWFFPVFTFVAMTVDLGFKFPHYLHKGTQLWCFCVWSNKWMSHWNHATRASKLNTVMLVFWASQTKLRG